jgi:hypothetical protein
MGIEPTVRCWRTAGFEDQEGHQTPFASGIGVMGRHRRGQGPTAAGARSRRDAPGGACAKVAPEPPPLQVPRAAGTGDRLTDAPSAPT